MSRNCATGKRARPTRGRVSTLGLHSGLRSARAPACVRRTLQVVPPRWGAREELLVKVRFWAETAICRARAKNMLATRRGYRVSFPALGAKMGDDELRPSIGGRHHRGQRSGPGVPYVLTSSLRQGLIRSAGFVPQYEERSCRSGTHSRRAPLFVSPRAQAPSLRSSQSLALGLSGTNSKIAWTRRLETTPSAAFTLSCIRDGGVGDWSLLRYLCLGLRTVGLGLCSGHRVAHRLSCRRGDCRGVAPHPALESRRRDAHTLDISALRARAHRCRWYRSRSSSSGSRQHRR